MNQFFYESRGKEKVRDLMAEGTRNQSLRRLGLARSGIRQRLPRLAFLVLGILGVLGLLLL